jgi:hypothetical protein
MAVKGKDELAFAYVIRLHFMRVRILSESEQQTNLPQIRSWFNVDKENTVASLKLGLCASVPALRDARVRTTELVLTLDGFELLDDSSIHVLRDGDLIWYVERHIPFFPLLYDLCKSLHRRTHVPKRSAEVVEDAPRKRQRQLPSTSGAAGSRVTFDGTGRNGFYHQVVGHPGRNRSTKPSSSLSSDSTSDSSSGDSSTDSDSTSGSSSDSGTTSASSSSTDDIPPPPPHPPPSSAFQRKPIQPTYVIFFLIGDSSVSWVRHRRSVAVPPGFGKPQTRARNERRRKKRLVKCEDNVATPSPAGSSNAMPLGSTKSLNTPEPMMMSMKNKNKRRGFKNTTSIPSHITFGNDEVAPRPSSTLVPPSKRDQLPPGLFVTSVDVEEDMWPRDGEQAWDRKRKKIQRDAYGQEDEADITLDYGRTPEQDSSTAASGLDYTALEKAWVSAPPLVEKTTFSMGSIVGWQVRQLATMEENDA